MIRLAMQKSGRLTEKSLSLLKNCGLDFRWSKSKMLGTAKDFPLEVLMVRDDDIPQLLENKVSDLGLLGENVLYEKAQSPLPVLREMGFSLCRLSFALPVNKEWNGPQTLEGLRIATSYPQLVTKYLKTHQITSQIVNITGSVELAPSLDLADCVCDLVSTGSTLKANGLKETDVVLESQCVLAASSKEFTPEKQALIDRLLQRIEGVQKAQKNKYIMMNATRSRLPEIREILPGMEQPSIMPLDGDEERIAIHTVCSEPLFWDTMEKLKDLGATSVLVVPIEKIL